MNMGHLAQKFAAVWCGIRGKLSREPARAFISTLDSLPGSFTMERRNEAKRSSVKLRSIAEGFSWVRAFLGSVLTLTKNSCARIVQERRLRLRSTDSIPPFFASRASQCHRKAQGATTSLYFPTREGAFL